MFQQLIAWLAHWLGNEAEAATYHAIKNGARRGADRAVMELTGRKLDPADLLGLEKLTGTRPPEALGVRQGDPGEADGPEPPQALPTFTRTEIHALKREELLDLIARRGWQIDTEGNVKEIREAVFQELDI